MTSNRNQTSKNRFRPAYTLNEMLVVVAVIGALTAMAFPMLRKPLAKQQLRAAAKQLRADLMHARLEAIERGETLQFRYLPGTNAYRVEPADETVHGESTLANGANALGGEFRFQSSQERADHVVETVETQAADAAQEQSEKLPEDIRFANRSLQDDLNDPEGRTSQLEPSDSDLIDSDLVEQWGGREDPDALGDGDWSEPIIFYPNGRTSNGVIQLVGERDYRIRLMLRGVTGAIAVSSLELPPADEFEENEFAEKVSPASPSRVARPPARSAARPERSPSRNLFSSSIHGIPTSRAPQAR